MIAAFLAGLSGALLQGGLALPCPPRLPVVSEQANRVLIGCADKPDFYVLRSTDGRVLAHEMLSGPAGVAINNIALSPDGREAAVGWRDGTIIVWRIDDHAQRGWKAPFYANSLAFAPDGQRLYVDGTEIDPRTARPTARSLKGDFDAPNDIAFDLHGRIAVVAEADTTLRLFDLASGKQLRVFDFKVEPMSVDVEPVTGDIVAGLADGSIARFDSNLRPLGTYAPVAGMLPVAILADRSGVVVALARQTGGAEPVAWRLDYQTGQWRRLATGSGALAMQRGARSILLLKLNGDVLAAETVPPR